MPDNDRVPRAVPGRWRDATRLAMSDFEWPVVGALIDRALAAEVREFRPPSPLLLMEQVRLAAVAQDQPAIEEAKRVFLVESGATPLACDILDAAEVMVETRGADLGAWPGRELAAEVVADALRRIAARGMFGSELVAERMLRTHETFKAVEERQSGCLEAAQYDALAAQIVVGRSESARAPANSIERPDLDDLLNEPVR